MALIAHKTTKRKYFEGKASDVIYKKQRVEIRKVDDFIRRNHKDKGTLGVDSSPYPGKMT
jgi:hypothetical protein